jgi:hypothetical protein
MLISNLNVGDLITSKHNSNMVGVVEAFSIQQGVFWIKWFGLDESTIYSAHYFNTMFLIVSKA